MASTMSPPATEENRYNCGRCAVCNPKVWNYWYGTGQAEARSEAMKKDPAVRFRIAHARKFLPKRTGPKVQDIAVACIKAGKNFADTIKEVLEKIPDCQMKIASFNWYKAKVAKGILVLLILPLFSCSARVLVKDKSQTTTQTNIYPTFLVSPEPTEPWDTEYAREEYEEADFQ